MENKLIDLENYKKEKENIRWFKVFSFCQRDLVKFLYLCRSNYYYWLFKGMTKFKDKDIKGRRKRYESFCIFGIEKFDELRSLNN